MDQIRIQLMGGFMLFINEMRADRMLEKSRKGAALMQVLLVGRGQSISTARLIETLWPEEESANPENALKTLVSRLRSLLNQMTPDLGKCIISDRGSYLWRCPPELTVDYYEVEDLVQALDSAQGPQREPLIRRLLDVYAGDLLLDCFQNDWARARATALHSRYLEAVRELVELLKARKDDEGIIAVCRRALEVDGFDDTLHLELMDALIGRGRTNEAMTQYKYLTNLYYQGLGIRPSDEVQAFYKRIVSGGKNLEFSLESIRNELRESDGNKGAFVCEYAVFKDIFNLQMRNLERLGSTMFLGLVQIVDLGCEQPDPLKQDHLMRLLMDVLQSNLRKGDTVSLFNTDVVAMLLPMVNHATGKLVMERLKREYYKKLPTSNVTFHYRIGPLSSHKKK